MRAPGRVLLSAAAYQAILLGNCQGGKPGESSGSARIGVRVELEDIMEGTKGWALKFELGN